jgi:excisionase family DNA binding protein
MTESPQAPAALASPALAPAPPATPTAPAPTPPLLCSAAEACRLLGIGKSLFYALKSSGRLPAPVRLGRAVRWNRETLIAWCNAGCPSAERFEALTRKDRR